MTNLETTRMEIERLYTYRRLVDLLPCVDEAEARLLDQRRIPIMEGWDDVPRVQWTWNDIRQARQLLRSPIDPVLMSLSESQQAALLDAIVYDSQGHVSGIGHGWVGVPGAAKRVPRSRSTNAGIIRGELELSLPHGEDFRGVAEDGTIYWVVRNEVHGMEATINTGEVHPLLAARSKYQADYLSTLISPRYVGLSLHSITPWPASPVPIEVQQDVIDHIKDMSSDGIDGWLLLGPPGTSKTALVSAWLKDEITLRLADATRTMARYELSVWKTKFRPWLEEMYAWMYRDHVDGTTREPLLTPRKIRESSTKSGFRPVLWIEEIDKVAPTPKQLNLFNDLVDAVYELGGLIIVTGNGTLASLRKNLDDSTIRRFVGDADDSSRFKKMNFAAIARPRTTAV